jgi:tetratricopeptide (TPR) repeat protein
MPSVSYGLAMIASNEINVIKRCLDSVSALIDQYLIQVCDEKDPMIPIIEQVLKGKHYDIVVHPWKNFGYNRSLLMLEARALLETDMIVVIDAKEVLVRADMKRPITPETKLEVSREIEGQPNCDVFFVDTIRGNGSSRNSRLNFMRNNQAYWYKFPVHEQLKTVSGERSKCGCITTIINYARYDGVEGVGSEKYTHYAKILKDYLAENNDDSESVDHCNFYIGQSYCDANNFEDGLVWYTKHYQHDRCSLYSYISRCRAAWILYVFKKDYKQAELIFREAIALFPSNPKAYVELSEMLKILNRYRECVELLETSLTYKDQQPDTQLFGDDTYYKWKIIHSLMVCYQSLNSDESASKVAAIKNQLLQENLAPDSILNSL